MLLKPGTWWAEEWNKIIMPALEDGRIKTIKSIPARNRRQYQLFYGVLEEGERQYRVTAYGYPNNKPHVHVELIGKRQGSQKS